MRTSLGYDYRLRITRKSDAPAVQDPETGVWTEVADVVVYDGPADVQDRGESLPRRATGQPVKVADATLFLPEHLEHKVLEIAVEDKATVYYPNSDRFAEGEVKATNELDGTLLVTYR